MQEHGLSSRNLKCSDFAEFKDELITILLTFMLENAGNSISRSVNRGAILIGRLESICHTKRGSIPTSFHLYLLN